MYIDDNSIQSKQLTVNTEASTATEIPKRNTHSSVRYTSTMCRIHQGFVFRCPLNSGGCGDTFFQTQQEFLDTGLVDWFFDRARAPLLKDPRKLAQAKMDPKTLRERAKRDKEKAETPAVLEEQAFRAYCKVVVDKDLWIDVKDKNLSIIWKAIGACEGGVQDEYCPNKNTVCLWDYFGGEVFTKYCIHCSEGLKDSKSGQKQMSKQAKQNTPDKPIMPTKLPSHPPDDARWRGRFSREYDDGAWTHTEKGEFCKNQDARVLTTRGARQTSAPSVITDTSENTGTFYSGVTSHGDSGSAASRPSQSAASTNLPYRSTVSQESSDMYGPGDEACDGDGESDLPRSASSGGRTGQSRASSTPRHLTGSTHHTSASLAGSTESEASSRHQHSAIESRAFTGSAVTSNSRSELTHTDGSVASTYRQSGSFAQSDTLGQTGETATDISRQGRPEPTRRPSDESFYWNPEQHATSRPSKAVAQRKRAPREGEKMVRFTTAGESGDESGKYHRKYHTAPWREEETARETAERLRKQRVEDDQRESLLAAERERAAARGERERKLDDLDSSSSSDGTVVPRPKTKSGKSKGKGKGKAKEPHRGNSSKKHRKR